MTESAAPKKFLTRRRVVVGAVAVAAIAAMAVGRPNKPAGPEMVFLRFESWKDGTASALVRLRNTSKVNYLFITQDGGKTVACLFTPSPSRNQPFEGATFHNSMGTEYVLKPSCEATGMVLLQNEGLIGRVHAAGFTAPRDLSGVRAAVRKLWWRWQPFKTTSVKSELDEEIQCPKRRPDATVEPPRIIPKAGKP